MRLNRHSNQLSVGGACPQTGRSHTVAASPGAKPRSAASSQMPTATSSRSASSTVGHRSPSLRAHCSIHFDGNAGHIDTV